MSSEARHAQLVDAAVDALAEGGHAALTLEAVAGRAGVTRNLLYHYFPSGTGDLFAAAVERAGRELTDDWSLDPSLPLPERIAANFARMVDHAAAPSRAWTVHRLSLASDDPRVHAINDRYEQRIVAAIAENNLGTPDPPPLARAALRAFLAYGESLLDAMREQGLPRDDVVGVLGAQLDATIRAVAR